MFFFREIPIGAFLVAANTNPGTGVNLAYPKRDELPPDCRRFPGGEDQPGIGHGEADNCHYFLKIFVRHIVPVFLAGRSKGGIDRRFNPGHGDGVGPDPEPFFQVDGVEDEAHHLKLPVVKAEKGPDPHIVNPGLHRPVQPVEAPLEIAFLVPRRVDRGIGLTVVGLLEDLESADPGLVQLLVFIYLHGGGVDVDPADLPAPLFGAVSFLNTLTDEVCIIRRVFPEDQDQTLLPLVDQGADFRFQFVKGEGMPLHSLICPPEPAINAVVYTFVPHVEGGKKDDPVAVNGILHFPGCLVHFRQQLRVLHLEQGGGLFRFQPFLAPGFGQDIPDLLRIGVHRSLQQAGNPFFINKIPHLYPPL